MKKFADKQKKEFDKFAIKNKDINIFLDNQALLSEFNTILFHSAINNILDFGCGIERISLKLAKIAKSVIGVDISEQSIKAANENAKKYEVLNFKGFILDEKISIEYQKYFDYILLINVIYHVGDINIK
ncbi:MAG: class I SAM-dependent methyltransferase [Candidatus Humimicrobiaceae bacterium]